MVLPRGEGRMPKYLILTGGSQGVGEKTIQHFVNQGWQAVNLSRSPCRIKGVQTIQVDLTVSELLPPDEEKLIAIAKSADSICLVHNAAAFKRDRVGELAADSLRSVLNLNVVSPVILNNKLIPYMKTGSSIIYIGSTLAELAIKDRASYVISKHAVVGLMRATCQDVTGTDIHTCCICPGFVNTKMVTDNVDMASFMAFIKSKVLPQRLIEPEEIAEFIYYCALHPIINGSVLHANLGQITT